MRALSRKLATPLRRHVLCPCRGLDCPRCFAQCEALRRTASVLNTHGYCICLVVCGGPAPAAARRPPPQAGAEPPARPELVLHGLRAFARRARARAPVGSADTFGGHRRIGDGGARCHTVPHPPGAWHARTHGGHRRCIRRCIFRNCGDFFRTRTRAAEHHPFTAPAVRGRREGRDARAEAGGSGRPHTRTRISVRDRLTTQPRPLLRRPTCGNPQRLMCCHRTRRPPCHA